MKQTLTGQSWVGSHAYEGSYPHKAPEITFGDTPATHLMLSKDDLAQLTALLGRNIADADDLLLAARNVTTLSVKGLEEGDITLEPYLLNRLKSRCHPTEYFPQFLRDRVKELLAGYAGC